MVDTPDDWKQLLSERTVEVFPLVRDSKRQHQSGWCTYTYEHAQAPELEVLCGGINSKTPKAGAIWRQGNLLHFGFDLSPTEMNQTGQDLLLNAIAYISRFTEDRPIVQTPCVFVQGKRLWDRDVIAQLVKRPAANLYSLKYYLANEEWDKLKGKNTRDVEEWFQRSRDYLHADESGKLTVDRDAESFGISPASADFIEKAIAALDNPARALVGRQLLRRYVPEGPSGRDSPAEWRSWSAENKPYLFFSDTGGFRWYIDPLAKKRGIPTAMLRGPARATLPVVHAGVR